MLRSLALLLVLSLSLAAEDWPQWRGPARDGRSAETGLAAEWPAGGPALLWQAEILGEGYASFAVVGGRLYTQGQKDGRQFVIALDAATGKLIWQNSQRRHLRRWPRRRSARRPDARQRAPLRARLEREPDLPRCR